MPGEKIKEKRKSAKRTEKTKRNPYIINDDIPLISNQNKRINPHIEQIIESQKAVMFGKGSLFSNKNTNSSQPLNRYQA